MICNQCFFEYSNEQDLVEHQLMEHGILPAPKDVHECGICSATFLYNNDLASHFENKHNTLHGALDVDNFISVMDKVERKVLEDLVNNNLVRLDNELLKASALESDLESELESEPESETESEPESETESDSEPESEPSPEAEFESPTLNNLREYMKSNKLKYDERTNFCNICFINGRKIPNRERHLNTHRHIHLQAGIQAKKCSVCGQLNKTIFEAIKNVSMKHLCGGGCTEQRRRGDTNTCLVHSYLTGVTVDAIDYQHKHLKRQKTALETLTKSRTTPETVHSVLKTAEQNVKPEPILNRKRKYSQVCNICESTSIHFSTPRPWSKHIRTHRHLHLTAMNNNRACKICKKVEIHNEICNCSRRNCKICKKYPKIEKEEKTPAPTRQKKLEPELLDKINECIRENKKACDCGDGENCKMCKYAEFLVKGPKDNFTVCKICRKGLMRRMFDRHFSGLTHRTRMIEFNEFEKGRNDAEIATKIIDEKPIPDNNSNTSVSINSFQIRVPSINYVQSCFRVPTLEKIIDNRQVYKTCVSCRFLSYNKNSYNNHTLTRRHHHRIMVTSGQLDCDSQECRYCNPNKKYLTSSSVSNEVFKQSSLNLTSLKQNSECSNEVDSSFPDSSIPDSSIPETPISEISIPETSTPESVFLPGDSIASLVVPENVTTKPCLPHIHEKSLLKNGNCHICQETRPTITIEKKVEICSKTKNQVEKTVETDSEVPQSPEIVQNVAVENWQEMSLSESDTESIENYKKSGVLQMSKTPENMTEIKIGFSANNTQSSSLSSSSESLELKIATPKFSAKSISLPRSSGTSSGTEYGSTSSYQPESAQTDSTDFTSESEEQGIKSVDSLVFDFQAEFWWYDYGKRPENEEEDFFEPSHDENFDPEESGIMQFLTETDLDTLKTDDSINNDHGELNYKFIKVQAQKLYFENEKLKMKMKNENEKLKITLKVPRTNLIQSNKTLNT